MTLKRLGVLKHMSPGVKITEQHCILKKELSIMRRKVAVVFCIAVLQLIITCEDNSHEPENVNPLIGTWKLDKIIFSINSGTITSFDTLYSSSGLNKISGSIELKIDKTCIYYWDIKLPVPVHDKPDEMPPDTNTTTPVSDTGTWYSNDTLLVIKGKTLDEYKFKYSIQNIGLITESIENVDIYNIFMSNYWIKQSLKSGSHN